MWFASYKIWCYGKSFASVCLDGGFSGFAGRFFYITVHYFLDIERERLADRTIVYYVSIQGVYK